jgi:hypothetical protein
MYIISTLRLKVIGLGFEIENNRVFKKGWNLNICCKRKRWKALWQRWILPHIHWLFGLTLLQVREFAFGVRVRAKKLKWTCFFFGLVLSQVQKMGMVLKFRAFIIKGIVPNFPNFENMHFCNSWNWAFCTRSRTLKLSYWK